eukprot:7924-Eustigmatos_ZCMA.PRE.1
MLSGAKLRPRIAISGEINLRGELLQIGNVKVSHTVCLRVCRGMRSPHSGVLCVASQEKVVAAARQGLTHIVMPSANIKAFR